MNTFEKRSRYFRELSLYLQRNGFTTQDNLDQMLPVEWKELPLCRITEGASVLYRQKDIKNPGAESALHQATDIACAVYEYMAILDQAPTLKADGLAEPYRLISEFNGTVLAAKESRYGVEFATWEWVNDHSSLWQGHYFLVRKGILPPSATLRFVPDCWSKISSFLMSSCLRYTAVSTKHWTIATP